MTFSEEITLIKNEEIITGNKNIAKILNTLFSNTETNLNIHDYQLHVISRSSRPELFYKKGVLVLEVSLHEACNLKKRLWHRCFPVNFLKFLRTTFFIEQLWCLLLNIDDLIIRSIEK